MSIQYIEPLSRGFARMKKALFNPFDIKKWFVVGFTAFLAGGTRCGFQSPTNFGRHKNVNWQEVLYFPQKAWEWLGAHPVWTFVIVFAAFLLFGIGLVVAWLNARGKFMFLDNVAHDRSLVAVPWREYKDEGNSFFVFNFVLGMIVLVCVIAYLLQCFAGLQAIYESSGDMRALIGPAILAGVGLIAISVVMGFITLLLNDFVVPIMYKDRCDTWKAILKFFPLFLSNFLYFIGYALFLICLAIIVGVGVIIAGCVTCCIGFLLLAIPYIGSVVTLPILYAWRAFSVEFLEQFGPQYQIFPRPEPNPPDMQATAI